MTNPRTKGSSGEREASRWLEKKLSLEYQPMRLLGQARDGGGDIHFGFTESEPIFCVEVKRRETIALNDWWYQVICAVNENNLYPVVMFRKNRMPWEFLISAQEIKLNIGFIRLSESVFVEWARTKMDT